MNWSGIFIAVGLVAIAAAAGPVGWVIAIGVAVWLWRRG